MKSSSSARTSSIHEEYTDPTAEPTATRVRPPQTIRFEDWDNLAYSISNEYARKFQWLRQDLESVATMALLEAIERFDSTRGTPFIAYGRRFINGRVLDYIGREMKRRS